MTNPLLSEVTYSLMDGDGWANERMARLLPASVRSSSPLKLCQTTCRGPVIPRGIAGNGQRVDPTNGEMTLQPVGSRTAAVTTMISHWKSLLLILLLIAAGHCDPELLGLREVRGARVEVG
ncbi:hypothetical protein J6590_039064 [Homalodisca vitripennis]|nr:hypothetical protein J6590_039064 [Homalodisca vitripennis]